MGLPETSLNQQTALSKKGNQKLRCKYSGPFEILEKIGNVAYRLNLPEGTLVHPVFHVSQLKGHIGTGQMVLPTLPIDERNGQIRALPEAILGRRMVKRNNIPVPQILVQWAQLGKEEATWEDYDEIRKQFPGISLEDKTNFEGEGMSEPVSVQLRQLKCW